jgi:serine/threonine protein kinase
MEDLIGQTLLNRYCVEDFIGRGGMAEVYRARDLRRRITVALKFLREDMAEDEVFLRRFRREAKVLETLQHPNIVRYFGFEENDNLHFLVAEFIDGDGLRKKLSQLPKPLTLGQALTILEPVCNALHYAHAEGISHCDIKPANIMIDKSGRVVVADFGIAKLAESATMTSSSTGTPAYMAPEQCRGQKVDARTDLYALAITAFEMLTLDRPFTGDTAAIQGAISERIRWEQLKATPPSPRKYNPEIPEWAEQAILKALEKPRNRRFSTVLAFYDALSHEGKVTCDPALPWTEGDVSESLMPTLAEPSTPRGSTRSGQWEQRFTDALWVARRKLTNLSDRLHAASSRRSPRLKTRLDGWLKAVKTGVLKTTQGLHLPSGPRLAYALVGVAVVAGIGLAVWRLAPTDGAGSGESTSTPIVLSTSTLRATALPTYTSAPANTPTSTIATATVYLTIKAKGANIRTGPATVYPIIATAALGDRFEVLARSTKNDWYQICCREGRSGWVHVDLVEVADNVAVVPAVTPKPPAPQQINSTPPGG